MFYFCLQQVEVDFLRTIIKRKHQIPFEVIERSIIPLNERLLFPTRGSCRPNTVSKINTSNLTDILTPSNRFEIMVNLYF